MLKDIDLMQISPKILMCSKYDGMGRPKTNKYTKRKVKFYEIEVFTQSDGGGIEVNGIFNQAKEGSINFRRPGEIVCGVANYSCYCIVFDLSGETTITPDEFYFSSFVKEIKIYKNPILDSIPSFLHPSAPEKYINMCEFMLREFIKRNKAFSLITKGTILQMLYLMYVDAKTDGTKIKNSPYYMTIKNAINYIHDNISSALNVSQVANHVGFSTSYFHRIFMETVGITPKKYIIKMQFEKAKRLLATTQYSITDISELCGFDNLVYFDYLFKKQIGKTPGEYRKQYKYF